MIRTRGTFVKDRSNASRYYADLKRKVRSFKVDLLKRQWCDLWHQHFDWKGKGNESWSDRRRHVSAVLAALSRAREELSHSGETYQLFASINPNDSGSDAVYVHTPNPNGTPFPIEHIGIEMHLLPPLLVGRVQLSRYRVFSSGDGKERHFIVEPIKGTA